MYSLKDVRGVKDRNVDLRSGVLKKLTITICGFDKLIKLGFNLMYMFGTNTTALIQIRSHIHKYSYLTFMHIFLCNMDIFTASVM